MLFQTSQQKREQPLLQSKSKSISELPGWKYNAPQIYSLQKIKNKNSITKKLSNIQNQERTSTARLPEIRPKTNSNIQQPQTTRSRALALLQPIDSQQPQEAPQEDHAASMPFFKIGKASTAKLQYSMGTQLQRLNTAFNKRHDQLIMAQKIQDRIATTGSVSERHNSVPRASQNTNQTRGKTKSMHTETRAMRDTSPKRQKNLDPIEKQQNEFINPYLKRLKYECPLVKFDENVLPFDLSDNEHSEGHITSNKEDTKHLDMTVSMSQDSSLDSPAEKEVSKLRGFETPRHNQTQTLNSWDASSISDEDLPQKTAKSSPSKLTRFKPKVHAEKSPDMERVLRTQSIQRPSPKHQRAEKKLNTYPYVSNKNAQAEDQTVEDDQVEVHEQSDSRRASIKVPLYQKRSNTQFSRSNSLRRNTPSPVKNDKEIGSLVPTDMLITVKDNPEEEKIPKIVFHYEPEITITSEMDDNTIPSDDYAEVGARPFPKLRKEGSPDKIVQWTAHSEETENSPMVEKSAAITEENPIPEEEKQPSKRGSKRIQKGALLSSFKQVFEKSENSKVQSAQNPKDVQKPKPQKKETTINSSKSGQKSAKSSLLNTPAKGKLKSSIKPRTSVVKRRKSHLKAIVEGKEIKGPKKGKKTPEQTKVQKSAESEVMSDSSRELADYVSAIATRDENTDPAEVPSPLPANIVSRNSQSQISLSRDGSSILPDANDAPEMTSKYRRSTMEVDEVDNQYEPIKKSAVLRFQQPDLRRPSLADVLSNLGGIYGLKQNTEEEEKLNEKKAYWTFVQNFQQSLRQMILAFQELQAKKNEPSSAVVQPTITKQKSQRQRAPPTKKTTKQVLSQPNLNKMSSDPNLKKQAKVWVDPWELQSSAPSNDSMYMRETPRSHISPQNRFTGKAVFYEMKRQGSETTLTSTLAQNILASAFGDDDSKFGPAIVQDNENAQEGESPVPKEEQLPEKPKMTFEEYAEKVLADVRQDDHKFVNLDEMYEIYAIMQDQGSSHYFSQAIKYQFQKPIPITADTYAEEEKVDMAALPVECDLQNAEVMMRTNRWKACHAIKQIEDDQAEQPFHVISSEEPHPKEVQMQCVQAYYMRKYREKILRNRQSNPTIRPNKPKLKRTFTGLKDTYAETQRTNKWITPRQNTHSIGYSPSSKKDPKFQPIVETYDSNDGISKIKKNSKFASVKYNYNRPYIY